MSTLDHKKERSQDLEKIKNSTHPQKVVVAGPGTGKSFLFSELIKKKQSEGKSNFLAITFIGKLGDALADDLCGLAETVTLHGFARTFLLSNYPGWNYYPKIHAVIEEDLKAEGITSFKIGDAKYLEKTNYYKAVGDADVIHYTSHILKKDPNKIPQYDLILIDEYQDFNEIESELVDLLSRKNEIVIVGDDDQALYEFKGSSPSFIREKYDPKNTAFESHTLRFCSRCTEVIVKYLHKLVEKFNLNEASKGRIRKEYICYIPDKEDDSRLNPQIYLLTKCPPGMIAYKIQHELDDLVSEQKIKSVLIIGEGQSCGAILKSIAFQLKRYGFKNIDSKFDPDIFNIQQETVEAYKLLKKDDASLLGWRILKNPTDIAEREKHLANSKTLTTIINGTLTELEKIKPEAIESLESSIEEGLQNDKDIRKNFLIQEIRKNNIHLSRPLNNLDITICNILNSKGLGADIVFIVGFDEGRFPAKTPASDGEVYQMLVAITRAKKRLYLINTVRKKVSSFLDCIDKTDLHIEEVTT